MSSATPSQRRAPGTRPTAQDLLSKRSWRLRHSIWLLAPILGLGLITWAAFLYIGMKAKRRDWQVAGVLYAIATAVLFYFTDDTEGPQGQSNEWLGGAIIALWAAGIVHALLSNKNWLRWRSQNNSPWYAAESTARPVMTPAFPHSSPLPPQLAGTGLDTQYYGRASAPASTPMPGTAKAPGASWTSAMTQGQAMPSGPGSAPAPAFAVESAPERAIDVNTATVHELAQLPGLGLDRAHRVARERQARSGFGSIAEFADAAGLAPHEHSRIRPYVVCDPPPRGPATPGYGRVLDY